MPHCPSCMTSFAAGQYCPQDGTRLVAGPLDDEESLVGQVIGERYRVAAKLGAGAMGTVYKAEHCYINKRVAIKLLRSEVTADPQALARFQREALAASTIGHENIVAIDDFGRLPDGQIYLTMECLEGQPLSQLLGRGPLAAEQIVEIMVQTCRGLAAAHAKGIIHRDMKPENMFLCDAPQRIKILDFGIAKVIHTEGEPTLSRTGVVFGTPCYMAPEQALGRKVDARADIYALGVILYELLTGRVPFQGKSCLAVLTQHITTPPLPPRQAAPERCVPRALEAITLRAMAKNPDDRFPTMDALAEALLAARGQLHEEERAPGRPACDEQPCDEQPGPARRSSTPLLVGAVVAAVSLGAGGAALYLRQPARESRLPAATPLHQAQRTPARAVPAPVTTISRVKVLVTSIPSGANVFMEGKQLGKTPESLTVPVGQTALLRLVLAGYEEREVRIAPSAGEQKVVQEVRLVAKRSSRRRQPTKPRSSHGSDHGDQGSDHTGAGYGSSHNEGP